MLTRTEGVCRLLRLNLKFTVEKLFFHMISPKLNLISKNQKLIISYRRVLLSEPLEPIRRRRGTFMSGTVSS